MARYGKIPVKIPEGVKLEFKDKEIEVSGPKGTLKFEVPVFITVDIKEEEACFDSRKDTKKAKAMLGTTRSYVANMVTGVTEGWSKSLEINGPGYRAEVKEDELVLTLGFSHPVVIKAPEGISFAVEKNIITVEGADKEKVGQTAANIRESRKPNPYKGTGIKYQDEEIRRKAGKQAVGAGE